MADKVDPIQIQQAALNTDPTVLPTAVNAGLEHFASQPLKQDQLPMALDLLNSLADISPECKQKMGDLYKADVKAIAADPNKQTRLHNLFNEFLNTKTLQNNLEQKQEVAKQQAKESQAAYTQHLKAALDELTFATGKSIDVRRDKPFYEALGAIGHLWELLLFLKFVVPVHEEFYAKGFKFKAPDTDEYQRFLREQHGDKMIFPNDTNSPFMQSSSPLLKA